MAIFTYENTCPKLGSKKKKKKDCAKNCIQAIRLEPDDPVARLPLLNYNGLKADKSTRRKALP